MLSLKPCHFQYLKEPYRNSILDDNVRTIHARKKELASHTRGILKRIQTDHIIRVQSYPKSSLKGLCYGDLSVFGHIIPKIATMQL